MNRVDVVRTQSWTRDEQINEHHGNMDMLLNFYFQHRRSYKLIEIHIDTFIIRTCKFKFQPYNQCRY